jgi:CBS domain-containing membrane protein
MQTDSRPVRHAISRVYEGLIARLRSQYTQPRLTNYIFQCGLATASLFVIFLVEGAVFKAAIVVGIASTAFIIFVVPNSVAATPRRVIGGHSVAIATGSLVSAILMIPAMGSWADENLYIMDIAAAISVGMSIFLMVMASAEHPPAAGTALGLVVHGWSWDTVVFVLTSALILSAMRILLRPRLVNLL